MIPLVSDYLASKHRVGEYAVYAGSMPLQYTEGQDERERELCRKATKISLMVSVTFDKKTQRKYFFLLHGRLGESLDYSPDVSSLCFGDLEIEDSEGYVCREKQIPLPTVECLPLPLLTFPNPQRIPEGGDKKLASRKCFVCRKRIGYGRIYYEVVQGLACRDCVGDEVDESLAALLSVKPVWNGGGKELPKPRKREAA